MEVFETPLPGVGVRYDFSTVAGDRMGVVVRRDARRELLLYDRRDPDSCTNTVRLTGPESATLVELLGGTKLTERLVDLRHEVEGLSIEWVTMPPLQDPETPGLTGRTIGDGQIRARTRASVVAVLRGDTSIAGPGPDFRFEAGDVALVIGPAEGVRAAAQLLAG